MTTFELHRIFHPSDFSGMSDIAFIHALRLALFARSKLTIYHTAHHDRGPDWQNFAHVREVLERWQILPPHSTKQDVIDLGLGIEKVSASHYDPVSSILGYLEHHPHDLLVLATSQHEGLERWTRKAIAEPVARKSGELTLFIPHHSCGFVSAETGAIGLRNVLIPFDRLSKPKAPVEIAAELTHLMGAVGVRFHLLHIFDNLAAPAVYQPHGDSGTSIDNAKRGFSVHNVYRLRGDSSTLIPALRCGNVVEEILAAADETDADLIVMTTKGENGFLDALRGSTTEHIVRYAECPVLAVPALRLPEQAPIKPLIVQHEV